MLYSSEARVRVRTCSSALAYSCEAARMSSPFTDKIWSPSNSLPSRSATPPLFISDTKIPVSFLQDVHKKSVCIHMDTLTTDLSANLVLTTYLLPTMPNPRLCPVSKFRSTLKRSHMSSGVFWLCRVCVVSFCRVSVTGSLYIHSRTRCGLKRRTLKASS